MQVLDELISGTIPSHRLFATLKIELFGILFEIKDLVYAGQHASRLLFKQQPSNCHVIIRKNVHNQLICVVSAESFRFKTVFNVVDAKIYINLPR